jgi:hypothetical protein
LLVLHNVPYFFPFQFFLAEISDDAYELDSVSDGEDEADLGLDSVHNGMKESFSGGRGPRMSYSGEGGSGDERQSFRESIAGVSHVAIFSVCQR